MDKLTPQQLRELYGNPSGRAKDKVLTQLDKHAKAFINQSPFVVLSTIDANGAMDASPRGGQAGFVKFTEDGNIIIPDAKGNNRIDSLINIAETGQIATLFFIPGVDELLRINGNAFITSDATVLDLFSTEKIPLKTAIILEPKEIFLHCAKALMRSKFWSVEAQLERSNLPTMGEMLKDHLNSKEPAESQDAMVNRYQKDL
ncbi:MAG: pyridoxamine 5'-phosphate oxidase family protein [Crocinitomix sp.]|nr:pyridoxamine 5'-phosphate oxidase family protein [Crocinitomix sp.]